MAQGPLHVHKGVQRLHRGLARPAALLVLVGGVALLYVGRVPEHDVQQLGRQPGAVDIAPEALLHQQGDAPGVVDVGVGDYHVVDEGGGEVQLGVVPFVPALLKPAVHQQLAAVGLYTVAASGHRLGRAEKGQFHQKTPRFSILCCAGSLTALYNRTGKM